MTSEETTEDAAIQSALSSIGLSAMLILGATFLSQGLGLLTRITMARYLPVDGYGNVVIGLSVMNLAGIAALVGMPAALSRYLPGRESENERQDILASAFQMVGLLSIVFAVSIYLAAEPIASAVFNNEDALA